MVDQFRSTVNMTARNTKVNLKNVNPVLAASTLEVECGARNPNG